MHYILSEAGYPVDAATTAAAAHILLDLTSYRLVIADWQLPDGDGIYIADRALALGAWTIIITGHLSNLPPGTGARHKLLMKPISPVTLLAVVRDHNRRAIGQPAMTEPEDLYAAKQMLRKTDRAVLKKNPAEAGLPAANFQQFNPATVSFPPLPSAPAPAAAVPAFFAGHRWRAADAV